MTSDRRDSRNTESTQDIKVTVALPDLQMRRRIKGLLERSDIEVSSVGDTDRSDLLARLADGSGEVLVVRRSQLGAGLADRLDGTSDGASLVVIEGEDDPTDRSRLLAAGVGGVVPADVTAEQLADTVAKVAGASSHGGIAQPDAAGIRAEPKLADFLSRSPRMQEFLDIVERVKTSDTTLLISGETGVGKERLARAIHAESRRGAKPFVSVNCGALPDSLLESELFGHTKGSFTGAQADRPGRFEMAQGGTIFLDEIGEMPKHMQVRLLTVLQRREVRPIGADEPRPIDVRVIAATHRDLRQAVKEDKFREDLFYRLHVVPLRIPPLRERTEDIADLLGYFVSHMRGDLDRAKVRGFTEEAMALMLRHDWPGNVRELVNAVERSLLMCRGELIGPGDLPAEVVGGSASAGESAGHAPARADADAFLHRFLGLPLRDARAAVAAEFEKVYLEALLRETGGVINETAERAGMHVRSLHDRMKKHGLRKEEFRGDGD